MRNREKRIVAKPTNKAKSGLGRARETPKVAREQEGFPSSKRSLRDTLSAAELHVEQLPSDAMLSGPDFIVEKVFYEMATSIESSGRGRQLSP